MKSHKMAPACDLQVALHFRDTLYVIMTTQLKPFPLHRRNIKQTVKEQEVNSVGANSLKA